MMGRVKFDSKYLLLLLVYFNALVKFAVHLQKWGKKRE